MLSRSGCLAGARRRAVPADIAQHVGVNVAPKADAKPACGAFTDHTTIPRVGAHVAITGTLVREKNHKQWNEIHPVSRIEQR